MNAIKRFLKITGVLVVLAVLIYIATLFFSSGTVTSEIGPGGGAAQGRVGAVSYKFNSWGITKSDKIVVDYVKDPKVEGIVCWWSKAEVGGIAGTVGLAEDPSEVSLACRQNGPIVFASNGKPSKFSRVEKIAKEGRNWTSLKTMQIVRMCDPVNNTLVYMGYSDKIIDGSPKNALSVVPIQPWGGTTPAACKDHMD